MNLSGKSITSAKEEQHHWTLRLLHWFDRRFRPVLGWGTLTLAILLVLCLLYTLEQSRWLNSAADQGRLALLSICALLIAWWAWGWRADRALARLPILRTGALVLAYLGAGLLLVSEGIAQWLPNLVDSFNLLRAGAWDRLAIQTTQGLDGLSGRISLWWQVVRADEPVRDELILSLIAGLLLWLVAGITVALLRRTKIGLLAAAPIVALSIALLFWGQEDRSAIVVTLTIALLLHFWLHQKSLQLRWEAANLDYSPSLIVDRTLAALGAGVLVIALAALLPNLYFRPLALWYWHLMSPANQRVNEFREQFLPGLVSSTRWRSGVGGGGLPNEFLLGAGPEELGNMLVMVVRTNDAVYSYDQQPAGFYMRALTLAQYDGKGWRNPSLNRLPNLPANQRWRAEDLSSRRLLLQSVDVRVDSPLLFAAGELLEASVETEVDQLPTGELIGLRSWERRYTVVSAVPAVGEEKLRVAGDFSEDQLLPIEDQYYIQLPVTVPQRVRDLAAQLTITATTRYEKAAALEHYLRQFEYDLSVPELPSNIADVADYFLFDLQRGYCDYYATAFVVLARTLDIPARMATGYAVGSWDFNEFQWTITEAQAHSWPEVYFPQYGWIPFEPTAARSPLTRIDLSPVNDLSALPAQPVISMDEAKKFDWNWQMLIWLLPAALLLWGGWRFVVWLLATRHDPWQLLLRWGARRGHPMTAGDTILEYGEVLSDLFETQADRSAGNDGLRSAARAVTEMSAAVSELRYATTDQRTEALSTINERWQRVKGSVK